MIYYLICLGVLVLTYLINITYVSVFYHRGLTHGAIRLHPWVRKFVVKTGTLVTGLDPKPWACMHRRHHLYSDQPQDPHSPVNGGVWSVLFAQKNEFGEATWGLVRGEEKYTSIVPDLDFPVNYLSRNDLWWYPYSIHLAIALAIGLAFGTWLLAACYFVGLMSHPLQGWLVNGLGHQYGYRNFPAVADNSRNNLFVAMLVAGEGYQNNHHEKPTSANFGSKWWEFDLGYVLCHVARILHLIDMRNADGVFPTPAGHRKADGGFRTPAANHSGI